MLPDFVPMALIVLVPVLTVTGVVELLYSVPPPVPVASQVPAVAAVGGPEPYIQQIAAPDVPSESVRLGALVNMPPFGDRLGVATVEALDLRVTAMAFAAVGAPLKLPVAVTAVSEDKS